MQSSAPKLPSFDPTTLDGVSRRHFLRALLATPIAMQMDVEKLLWVPGQMVTVPSMSISKILELEVARITPKIVSLFDRDDLFYTILKNRGDIQSVVGMQVPLEVKNV